MKRTFNHVAKVVRHYRRASGISQTEASKVLGYKTGQFISNVERGECGVPFKKLAAFVRLFKIPAPELIQAMDADYKRNLLNALKTTETEVQNQQAV